MNPAGQRTLNVGRTLYERWTGWSPVLLLAALAALTFWLNAQVQPLDSRGDGKKRHEPDLFLTNFRAISYDQTGTVRQQLEAKKGQHYPDDDSVDFEQPALVVTRAQQPTLRVRAATGSISGDRETVLFRGDVHAVREGLPAKPGERPDGPISLTTEFLRVLPNRSMADTDQPVTIEEARGIIRGVGLVLDNQARTIRIRSTLRGTFLPGPTK